MVVIGFVLAIVGCVAGVLSISKGQDMSTINIWTKIGILTSVVAILFFLTSCTYVCSFKGGAEDGMISMLIKKHFRISQAIWINNLYKEN